MQNLYHLKQSVISYNVKNVKKIDKSLTKLQLCLKYQTSHEFNVQILLFIP